MVNRYIICDFLLPFSAINSCCFSTPVTFTSYLKQEQIFPRYFVFPLPKFVHVRMHLQNKTLATGNVCNQWKKFISSPVERDFWKIKGKSCSFLLLHVQIKILSLPKIYQRIQYLFKFVIKSLPKLYRFFFLINVIISKKFKGEKKRVQMLPNIPVYFFV